MKNFIITLSLVAASTISAFATTHTIDIIRGKQDTVTNAQHIIVAVTTPGATASINNKATNVYATGAFGDIVNLHEGNNQINISATYNDNTITQTINVVYKPSDNTTQTPQETQAIHLQTPIYLTTLPGAYFQYGNGGDRLGGSKIGYIDNGITLKAIEECGELYKIALSQNRFAYISKEYVKPTASISSIVNSGSISISKTGKQDLISISLPARLPYRSWTQLDPTTICVELFGATNNTNWLTQRGDLGMIEYVDLQQPDSDILKIIIKLKQQYSWGYSINYDGNNLKIAVKHTPNLALANLTIGLDAGHGGEHPGAISATGINEKDVNLDIVLRIARLLESKGAKIILSRDGDTGPTMAERKQTFIDANVDLMLSVHNNAGGSPLNEMGTSTYYKHINNRVLAQCMLNRLLELGLKDFGLTGNFNFSLNAPTEFPNTLLEVLFMSSLPEEEKLANPDFRQAVAEKAVLALEDYLDIVKTALINK